MRELELLSNKLDALLKKHAALQAENSGLKETIAQQQHKLTMLDSQLAKLEEKAGTAQIGKTVADDAERKALRKQLDGVIGEIDKILTTLND